MVLFTQIFAQDETGLNRPVCSYVRPWRCGRLLDSPQHAARFVSLIPFERIQPFGGSYVEQVSLIQGGNVNTVLTRINSLLTRGTLLNFAVLIRVLIPY